MNELKIFNNDEFGRIRAVEQNGEPWFVGKDVAEALGYKNPQEAIRTHIDDEDKGVSEIRTPGGKQNAPIINESGLYSLILSSKLPTAKKFKRWVTSEVLPSIRKTGSYSQPRDQKSADETKRINAEARLLNARARISDQYYKLMTSTRTKSEKYEAILISKMTEALAGEVIIPLPAQEHKTYSATEIGDLLGISSNMVGRLANKYHLKTEENGEYYRFLDPSGNERDGFRYFEGAVDAFREALRLEEV